jgi:hypothetical protein
VCVETAQSDPVRSITPGRRPRRLQTKAAPAQGREPRRVAMRRSAALGGEVARPVTELRRLSSSAHAILADVGNGLVDCMTWVKEADKIDKLSGELSGQAVLTVCCLLRRQARRRPFSRWQRLRQFSSSSRTRLYCAFLGTVNVVRATGSSRASSANSS